MNNYGHSSCITDQKIQELYGVEWLLHANYSREDRIRNMAYDLWSLIKWGGKFWTDVIYGSRVSFSCEVALTKFL